jgi:hypothetical protein
MRYREIIDYPRSFNRNTYPVVNDIQIESRFLDQLERRAADQAAVKVVGSDEAPNGLLTVYVAAVSEEAFRLFARRWSA